MKHPKKQPKIRFSESEIWQFQRDYFTDVGMDAWRKGEVPHYASSSPAMGKAYAELVLAFLRDLAFQGHHQETVYLVELGAGHGRLAYHFFKHFEKYYEKSAIALPPFCYVLSDFNNASIDFWETHPRLQPYIEKGWLDYAFFDAEKTNGLNLIHANFSIKKNQLKQPLVVIANYFFDTIPQELFKIEKGQLSTCLVTLDNIDKKTNTAEKIKELIITYDSEPAEIPIYPNEPILNNLVKNYLQQLNNTHLLFPHIGIRCLERLRSLSLAGALVLTADRGEHHLSNLEGLSAPKLSKHGSFSLLVNYHAFALYTELSGGKALFPLHQQNSLDVGCLMLLPHANEFIETQNSFDRYVINSSPDDYFTVKKFIELNFNDLTFNHILAIIRLFAYDAHFFRQMLPAIRMLLPLFTENDRWNLFQILQQVWDNYFPLGEKNDLAFEIGELLFSLELYEEAIVYYQLSITINGNKNVTLLNIASCYYCLLTELPKAIVYLEKIISDDPKNKSAINLLKRCNAQLNVANK